MLFFLASTYCNYYNLYLIFNPYPMETMTINTTQTKETLAKQIDLENCNDLEEIAMISVDNTQTFENKDLNELYVNEGEQAAHGTQKIMEACKYYGITMINVLEEHPI